MTCGNSARRGQRSFSRPCWSASARQRSYFLLSLTHWSFGPDGTSVRFNGFDPGNLYPLLGYIVLFVLYRRYYNARDAFFVN